MKLRILDTTIASLLLNQDPVVRQYDSDLDEAVLIISFQTVAEMRYGALLANWGFHRVERLEEHFRDFEVIEYSDGLAYCWAQVMLDARRAGRRLESADGWVAATAKFMDAPLVAHDTDFDARSCPSITVINYARQPG